MKPDRIETAEILSFRLKVPASELPRLPALLPEGPALSIEGDRGETVVSAADSDSYLRFKPIGPEAMLTEIFIFKDQGGRFFERVLVELMVRHRGELHARLVWSSPERNSDGHFAEVRIEKGRAGGEAEPSAVETEVQESLARARAHWAEYQRLKAKGNN